MGLYNKQMYESTLKKSAIKMVKMGEKIFFENLIFIIFLVFIQFFGFVQYFHSLDKASNNSIRLREK